MMITLTSTDLHSLAAVRLPVCVSIHMPIHGSKSDYREDALRLKNLLRQAHHELLDKGWKPTEIDSFLKEASSLEREPSFWRRHGTNGLSLLIEPNKTQVAWSKELVEEIVIVGDRYYLTPLIAALAERPNVLVLCVSGNHVRLYDASDRGLQEIALPREMPQGMKEALRGTEFEQGLQRHTTARSNVAGVEAAIVHGHGAPKDDQKTLTAEYVRIVLHHLEPILSKQTAPLAIAAVGALQPVIRQLCKYPQILDEGIVGSPEELGVAKIEQAASKLIDRLAESRAKEALHRYGNLQQTDKIAFVLDAVLSAADRGQIDTIFVSNHRHAWGNREENGALTVHGNRQTGDTDLLDLAVAKTVQANGTAYVLAPDDVPSSEGVAAILRW